MKIGSWNVTNMYESRKMRNATEEINRLSGICETRCHGTGQQHIGSENPIRLWKSRLNTQKSIHTYIL